MTNVKDRKRSSVLCRSWREAGRPLFLCASVSSMVSKWSATACALLHCVKIQLPSWKQRNCKSRLHCHQLHKQPALGPGFSDSRTMQANICSLWITKFQMPCYSGKSAIRQLLWETVCFCHTMSWSDWGLDVVNSLKFNDKAIFFN